MKAFLYETSMPCIAQDMLTESLQHLYICHNNVKIEVQAKLISLQINLVLKSMLGSRKGF